MKKNLKKDLKEEGNKNLKENFDYVSGIQCPECNSHYLRLPDNNELEQLIKSKKIKRQDKKNTWICHECFNTFVHYEEYDPEFEPNDELYYSKNNYE